MIFYSVFVFSVQLNAAMKIGKRYERTKKEPRKHGGVKTHSFLDS